MVSSLFNLLMFSLAMQKHFILMKSDLFIPYDFKHSSNQVYLRAAQALFGRGGSEPLVNLALAQASCSRPGGQGTVLGLQ